MQLFLITILIAFITSFVVGYGGFFARHRDRSKTFNQSIVKQEVISQPVEKLENLVFNFNQEREREAEMPEGISFTGMTVFVSDTGTSSVAGIYKPSYLEHHHFIKEQNFLPSDNLWGNQGQYESETVQKNRYRKEIINILSTRIDTLKKI